MNEFHEVFTNRPLPQLKVDTNQKQIIRSICPFCDSSDVKQLGVTSTMVGYFGIDSNHHWVSCKCGECEELFTHEYKTLNEWYTKDRKVLRGVPTCFEGYTYDCQCGGEVVRTFISHYNGKPTNITSYRDGKPQQDIMWNCTSCNKNIKTEKDHWQ